MPRGRRITDVADTWVKEVLLDLTVGRQAPYRHLYRKVNYDLSFQTLLGEEGPLPVIVFFFDIPRSPYGSPETLTDTRWLPASVLTRQAVQALVRSVLDYLMSIRVQLRKPGTDLPTAQPNFS